ncbi:MAG: hypothetical protein HYS14_09050 [Candidatus Rokubacteria bacterium]|nr:hypothetical protein [Candidatus Rokubacteria bacterium]
MDRFVLVVLLVGMPSVANAVEYECNVTRKLNSEIVYTREQLQRGQFSVRITDSRDKASLSRCSFAASAGKVTCDRYEVDRIAFDENVRIKKYYVFRSQFDVQVFSDLSFIENNGRGDISYGKCEVVSP